MSSLKVSLKIEEQPEACQLNQRSKYPSYEAEWPKETGRLSPLYMEFSPNPHTYAIVPSVLSTPKRGAFLHKRRSVCHTRRAQTPSNGLFTLISRRARFVTPRSLESHTPQPKTPSAVHSFSSFAPQKSVCTVKNKSQTSPHIAKQLIVTGKLCGSEPLSSKLRTLQRKCPKENILIIPTAEIELIDPMKIRVQISRKGSLNKWTLPAKLAS